MAAHAGKRAVVTGAARGIGLATAVRLRTDGAEVLGVDRNKPSDSPDFQTLTADLTSAQGREQVVNEIQAAEGNNPVYLTASRIDQATNQMENVVIYDSEDGVDCPE